MAKTGGGGCGCLTILSFLIVLATIVNFCENKAPTAIPPAPHVQAEQEKMQQRAKEDSERLEAENAKKREEEHRQLLLKVTTSPDGRFSFTEFVGKDKRTGLVWTRQGNFGSRQWNDALKLIKELNNNKYGGYSNWRLPSREEFIALVDYAYAAAKDPNYVRPYSIFNENGFYGVECGSYWTSNKKYKHTIRRYTDNNKIKLEHVYEAIGADLSSGRVLAPWAIGLYDLYVWPVSSGK